VKLLLQVKLGLDFLALALVFDQTGVDGRLAAFGAGLLLFDLNLVLVIYLAKRFFEAAAPSAAEAHKKANPLLVGALFFKVMILGAGAWLFLRVGGVDPLFFVAGLVAALVFFAGPATVLRRHFSLSSGAKVR
jgi:hypothetical protein